MRDWFLRGLGWVQYLAFRSLERQVLGLFGRRGLAPIADTLAAARAQLGRERYRRLPTIFWLDARDQALERAVRVGEASSLALAAGFAPRTSLAISWTIYLSFVTAGLDFMSFQWDTLLLESCVHAFVIAGRKPPARGDVALPRWLVFRLYFGSGAAKWHSRDPHWRRLTACAHHYESQPLPTRLGWYAHHAPPWLQRVSTALALGIEAGAPWLVLGPRRLRRAAFALVELLQAAIAATGNYGFFNVLSALLGVWVLDDCDLGARARAKVRSRPEWLALATDAPLLALSARSFARRFLPRPRTARAARVERMERALAPFCVTNQYGLFSVMTIDRPEIVIEGSNDGVEWREYELPYKPGDPRRPPRRAAPHQPRLDWQLWFAAKTPPPFWFVTLLRRLLEGAREVLALFEVNPFPERPPRFVRATLYDYRMTDLATRRRTGAWWTRRRIGLYFPPASLQR
ncbi:MAG TPA: lipase maturation factor family protein [Polyangia bacterium]|nr:lipase maturation factor family protein [Polyangia bacterium]